MNKFELFCCSCITFCISNYVFAKKKDKKCLVENINYSLTNLNPQELNDFSKIRVFDDIFEGLVSYDQNGTIIPGCAERWEISDDRRIYTFYLRNKLRWSNGSSLTANDFVRSFRDVINPQKSTKYFSYLFDNIENAREIRGGNKPLELLGVMAIDEQTLQIKLNSPDSNFLFKLCLSIFFPVYEERINKKNKSSKKNVRIIGNGAYKVAKYNQNGCIELKKNSKYWDADNVKIKKVKFLMIQDSISELQAFDAGEVNITDKNLPTQGMQLYRTKYCDEFKMYPIFGQNELLFNLENDKFKEVNVRKALSMAINKELYIEKIIKFGEASFNPIVEIFGKEFKEVYKDMKEYEWINDKYDKRAIDADLLMNEFFTEEKPLEIKITYPIGSFYANIAAFVQNSWEKVFKGAVKVHIEAKLEKDIIRSLREGNFEICLYNWMSFIPSSENFASFYVSGNDNNFSRYKNVDYDRIFYDLLTKMKEGLLESAFNDEVQLSKILLKDFVSIPLFYLPATRLISKNVGGFNCENNILDRYKTKDLYWVE